jgi:predicted helicase
MINSDLLSRGEVIVEGNVIRARTVANQIAIQKACEEHDLKKIFSFHRSVASAKDFTGDTASSIRTHLLDYEAYHVNGEMRTSEREVYMKAFGNAGRAIMSNARCLTEGVDVPAVDVVAFLSPRKSKVDIVQATGRAMRKPEGKEIGYVSFRCFSKPTGTRASKSHSSGPILKKHGMSFKQCRSKTQCLRTSSVSCAKREDSRVGSTTASYERGLRFSGQKCCLMCCVMLSPRRLLTGSASAGMSDMAN